MCLRIFVGYIIFNYYKWFRAVGESLSNLVDVCTSPVSKEKRFNTEKTFQVQEYSNDTGFIDQTNSSRNSSNLGTKNTTFNLYLLLLLFVYT